MTSNCQRLFAAEQIMPCVEQLMWMPSILFRLNSLLLADELRVKIITEAHIGGDVTGTSLWEPLCQVVTMEHPLDPDDGRPVTDWGRSAGPCPSLILQAISTPTAFCGFSLDRLEFLATRF